MSGVIQLTLLAWSVFTLTTAVVVAVLDPRVRTRVLALGPESRARALSLLAAAPLTVATALTAACFVPSLFTRAVGLSDHCTHHDAPHAHFCWTHRSAHAGSVGWILVPP